MSKNWIGFWDNYRNVQARSEDDLFVQVGKTIARKPIPRPMFASMVANIVERLALVQEDHLLDLCCGNGLVSFELAKVAGRVTAVDFARHLVEAARQLKSHPNIDYRVGDVSAPLRQLVDDTPNKFLMNDALAYFEPTSLDSILDNIVHLREGHPFHFLLTGIPNHALKWNFYDTPERQARHLENEQLEHNTNEGIGRWWRIEELATACHARGLQVEIIDQAQAISNYRMDALITPK
ncbi:MAG: methyltransferase domain-containing protein [Luteimonas sp.]